MVTHISTFHAVRTLCAKGPTHKNDLVRTATIRLLVCAVVIAGTENILNQNSSEHTRKRLFLNMVKFLEDKNLEARFVKRKKNRVQCLTSRIVYLLAKKMLFSFL